MTQYLNIFKSSFPNQRPGVEGLTSQPKLWQREMKT